MKKPVHITTLLWLLSQDPEIDLITTLMSDWEDQPPEPAKIIEEFHKIKPAEDEIALRWIVKKMQLAAWFIDKDEVMITMQNVPYEGIDSLVEQAEIFENFFGVPGEIDE